MNRAADISLRRFTVAIVFLCMTALVFCQVLGPTARLNFALAPADLSEQTYIGATTRMAGAHGALPARCASLKLAPIEIRSASFAQDTIACDFPSTLALIPPHSAEIGVPTPPPRTA